MVKKTVETMPAVQILMLRSALGIEVKCPELKHSRGSVYAQIKRLWGFKGNKAKVLQQLNDWIENNIPELSTANVEFDFGEAFSKKKDH